MLVEDLLFKPEHSLGIRYDAGAEPPVFKRRRPGMK